MAVRSPFTGASLVASIFFHAPPSTHLIPFKQLPFYAYMILFSYYSPVYPYIVPFKP